METPVQGGTLITCGFAKKLGRALMAVPGNLEASNVAEATMSLRLKKLIRFLPGNRVAPVPDGALVD